MSQGPDKQATKELGDRTNSLGDQFGEQPKVDLAEIRALVPALRGCTDAAIKRGVHESSSVSVKWLVRRGAKRVVSSSKFDYGMGCVIVFNVVAMIIEIDRAASEDEASGIHWTVICSWAVLCLFVLELMLRMAVLRKNFWIDPWNRFDFVLVVTDLIFSLVGLFADNIFPVSVLRIFRLAKLARVSKVLRVFPELRLLLAALTRSMSAIFWGSVLLFLSLLLWSMVAVIFIHPLNKRFDHKPDCDRCPRAYSSVLHALLTLTQGIVTSDSWGLHTIPLMEAHPITIPFFVAVFLSVGLAVLNLILGVVVEVAQKAKAALEDEESSERALEKLRSQTELISTFRKIDKDKDGFVTRDEVFGSLSEPGTIRTCMDNLDIVDEDFDIVWQIMDVDKKGRCSYKDLVNNLCNMRSSDSQFMLAYIKYYITVVKDTLLHQMKRLEDIQRGESQMQRMMKRQVSPRIDEEDEDIESHIYQQSIASPAGKALPESSEDRQFRGLAGTEIHQLDEDILQSASNKKAHGHVALKIREVDEIFAESQKHVHFEQASSDKKAGQSRSTRSVSDQRGSHVEAVPDSDGVPLWSQQFVSDLGTMRVELKDMLMDMNHKLGLVGFHIGALDPPPPVSL